MSEETQASYKQVINNLPDKIVNISTKVYAVERGIDSIAGSFVDSIDSFMGESQAEAFKNIYDWIINDYSKAGAIIEMAQIILETTTDSLNELETLALLIKAEKEKTDNEYNGICGEAENQESEGAQRT